MGLLETEALVLRTYNLAEADKIVVCLTRSAGMIRGVARGCRRMRSRFGAALEPFTLLNATYYQKENQELASLREAEIVSSCFDLSANAETLAGLAYMGDLIVEFSPPQQTNDKLFRMVKACLQAVSQVPQDMPWILRYFEVWLLKLEGFLPDIQRCAQCQRAFGEDESVSVSPELSLRCRSCSQGRGDKLSRKVRRQITAIQRLPPQAFAEESRMLPADAQELAELTHRMIGRVLERQPRVRPAAFAAGTP